MSYKFSTVGDRLSVVTTSVTAVPITIAGWVRKNTTGTQQEIFSIGVASAADHRFGLGQSSGDVMRAEAQEGAVGISSGDVLTDNVSWHHVAAVFTTATSRTVYLDGVAGTPNLANFTPTTPTLMVIGRRPDAAFWFNGKVAHFAVWNAALSGANIASLAGGAVPTTIGTPVNYWPLTADANDTVGSQNFTVQAGATLDADNPTLGGGGGGIILTQLERLTRGVFRGMH